MLFKRLFRKVENEPSVQPVKGKSSKKNNKKKTKSSTTKTDTSAPVKKEKKDKPNTKTVPVKKELPDMYKGRVWSVDDPIPYDPISCEDVSYKHVARVVESWEVIRKIPNFESVAGELLLRKMFELNPAFRVQFGFTEDADWNDPKVYQDKKFMMHGIALVVAVDKAVDFLGPDLEPLELELEDLGRRHIHMCAKPEYWPEVGEALFYALGLALGDDFDDKLKKAWTVVYHFLAYYMIRGLLLELSERR